MAYLNKDQRREMILQAATNVALNDGFSAMTVRRIATEAQTSTGQVHHHFASNSHLKAEAFVKLMQQLDEIETQVITTSYLQRVSLLLGCENIEQVQPYLRLWNEAEVLIDQDVEIKYAYNIAMQDWHTSIVNMIEEGKAANEFSFTSKSQDIAWRLIAFVCGLEGIYKLGLNGLNDLDFKASYAIIWPGMKPRTNPPLPVNNFCDQVVNTISIRWNGDVVPCCYDLVSMMVMGNVLKDDPEEIWNNKKYRQLREDIHSFNPPELCKNCEVLTTRNLGNTVSKRIKHHEKEKMKSVI